VATEIKSATHTLTLKGRSEVAERTLEIRFDKPAGMKFKAGQYMDLTLIDPPETDEEGNTRTFSINSAPDDPELWFTTRLRDSAFKRTIRTMPLGAQVKAEGPFGSFTLHNNPGRPAVMLAGGIGITPFRSMVRRAAHEKLPHRIVLIYANRRPEDAPFLDEFRDLEIASPRITFVPTMTKMGDSKLPWKGETGRIDSALIQRHLPLASAPDAEPPRPIFYIAGPPGMVASLGSMLNRAGIDDDDIRTEEFAGY